jgi:hypothetical protein
MVIYLSHFVYICKNGKDAKLCDFVVEKFERRRNGFREMNSRVITIMVFNLE